jgi:hypothetical protein
MRSIVNKQYRQVSRHSPLLPQQPRDPQRVFESSRESSTLHFTDQLPAKAD